MTYEQSIEALALELGVENSEDLVAQRLEKLADVSDANPDDMDPIQRSYFWIANHIRLRRTAVQTVIDASEHVLVALRRRGNS